MAASQTCLFSLCIHSDEKLFNNTRNVYSCFKILPGLKINEQKNACNAAIFNLFNNARDVYSCFKTLLGLKIHDQKNACNAAIFNVLNKIYFLTILMTFS